VGRGRYEGLNLRKGADHGFHNLLENALFTTVGAGTFIGGQNVGGTIGGVVNAGLYEQHAVVFLGTLGNTGTINVYACQAGGSARTCYSA
jgi:hypothetical protein